jgi:hypothetical protein
LFSNSVSGSGVPHPWQVEDKGSQQFLGEGFAVEWSEIQSTIDAVLLVGGSAVLALFGGFLISRQWLPVRIAGLLLLMGATDSAPDSVIWWASAVLAAVTVTASIFIAREIVQLTVQEVVAAAKCHPTGNSPVAVAAIKTAFANRSVRKLFNAVKSLVKTAGIRRIHFVLAGLLLASIAIAATLQLGAFTSIALMLATLLVGGAFVLKRETATQLSD